MARPYHEPLGLLKAGVFLARRLNMSVKFTLLAVILLIPLAIYAVLLLQRQGNELSVARSEIEGMAIVGPVANVINQVQRHRGQSAMLASGNQGVRPDLARTREALSAASLKAGEAIRAASAFDLSGQGERWQIVCKAWALQRRGRKISRCTPNWSVTCATSCWPPANIPGCCTTRSPSPIC